MTIREKRKEILIKFVTQEVHLHQFFKGNVTIDKNYLNQALSELEAVDNE